MPADVAEDSVDLAFELLEADIPDAASYPFPRLRRSGRFERRTFRTILLENQHFRTTVVPALGGRVLRWEDKRSGTDLWDVDPQTVLSECGHRGVELALGLQVRTGFHDRLNAMGMVANAPDYAEEGDVPSGLWLGEVCGDGLSLNWRLSAPDKAPFMELEMRAFNRSLEPVPYNGGISVGGGAWRTQAGHWIWESPYGNLLVECPYFGYSEGSSIYRFNRMRHLAPRQLDSWTAKIYPSGMRGSLRGANLAAHVGWDLTELRVQGIEPINSGKIVIRTTGAQTLEMPLEMGPEVLHKISLESLNDEIEELVLLDAHRVEVIRAPSLKEAIVSDREQDEMMPAYVGPNATETELRAAEFEVPQRHLSHVISGHALLGKGQFAEASRAFEQALLFNAEDHLAWWAKSAAERQTGTNSEGRPELLNAHFLAPLEPMLRAEGFLALPTQSREKASVLNPLEETPEAFVDVACLLLEANLVKDAAQWLTESLLHLDAPILHYLLAHVYLQLGGMEVDAAEQVRLATRESPEPPFPWRRVEREALANVASRFPDDRGVRLLMRIMDQARPPR